MLKFPFHMNPEVEIFLIFPFRLGVKTFPLSASKREEIFPRWAQRLNTRLPEFVWRAIPFDAANPVPSLIRKRKAIYLLGTSQGSASLSSWINEIVKDWRSFEVIEVRESIWYYDWGIGAVDVNIKLIVKEGKELNKLLEFGEEIHDFLKEEQKITLFREWGRYAQVLIETFTEGHHIQDKKEMPDFEFSGKMDTYGINLIVKTARREALEVAEEELKSMLSSFIGRSVKEQDFVHLPGVLAVAEGYNGQVAVFDSAHPSTGLVIERVRWIWRLVILYWTNLSVLGEFLSKRLIMTFSLGDRKMQEDLECLRRERLGLQLFLHELSPRNFCDDALDLRVYGGVWDAWQGEKLVKEIKEQLEFLQVYFSESVNLLTTELQSKINWILFILNILTFSTVIATLIIIYDIKNEIFLPNSRLLLVIMGTVLFGLLSLMFLVKGRLFKSLKGKQRGYWNIRSVPAELPEEVERHLVEWCLKLFERLDCRDYARFDWRLDASGNPKLLEVNPNPGWCWDGHLAKMAAIAGISYGEMLEAILKTAEARMLLLHKNERTTARGINKVSKSGE